MPLAGDISHLWRVERRLAASLPLMASTAVCGFPSPAKDYLDKPLDFNELLIGNVASTFAVRVTGDSMIDAGIFPRDIAVVDRSLTAVDRSIILALLDGAFTHEALSAEGRGHLAASREPGLSGDPDH